MTAAVTGASGPQEPSWMIYGAYGYTGELIAREAVRRGLHPVIAGRTESKLAPLAAELGLQYRVFDLRWVQDELDGLTAILNCAGPFSATARPMIEACLRARVHYIDITGEITVFQLSASLDRVAREAGIILCPGAGFDIVPTDCLAAMLKERMPDAQAINLAFSFGTRPSIGTVRTLIEGAAGAGLTRRDHRLVSIANGYRISKIPFANGRRWAVTIPWGDVYTSGISTGVPNGMVFTALPLSLCLLLRITNPLRRLLATEWAQRGLDRLASRLFGGGPNSQARMSQTAELWGEAVDAGGGRVSATISGPNVYDLTVDTALAIVKYSLSTIDRSGYFTPSLLLGAGFIALRPGVQVQWAATPQ